MKAKKRKKGVIERIDTITIYSRGKVSNANAIKFFINFCVPASFMLAEEHLVAATVAGVAGDEWQADGVG